MFFWKWNLRSKLEHIKCQFEQLDPASVSQAHPHLLHVEAH